MVMTIAAFLMLQSYNNDIIAVESYSESGVETVVAKASEGADKFEILQVIISEVAGCETEEVFATSLLREDLGLDSLDILEVLTKTEDEFMIDGLVEHYEIFRRVIDIYDYILAESGI